MGQRWEHQLGWPATWSHGEQPNPSPTYITETAWLMRMRTGRSVQRCVFLYQTCCINDVTGSSFVAANTSLSSWCVFRMCQWGSITSKEDRKGKMPIFYSHSYMLEKHVMRCIWREDFSERHQYQGVSFELILSQLNRNSLLFLLTIKGQSLRRNGLKKNSTRGWSGHLMG